MAKDKAAKERKRAEKKKAKRVRDQERRAETNKLLQAADAVWEGRGTPEKTALLINAHHPKYVRSAGQRALEDLLTRTEVMKQVALFVRAASLEDPLLNTPIGGVTGSVFMLAVEETGKFVIDDMPMSKKLWFVGDDPLANLRRDVSENDYLAGAWVLWSRRPGAEALLFAADPAGNILSWIGNGRSGWTSINVASDAIEWLQREQQVADEVDRMENQFGPEYDALSCLASLLKMDQDQLMTIVKSLDDPRRKDIVDLFGLAQMHWHNVAVSLARRWEDDRLKAQARVDAADEDGYLRGSQNSAREIDRLSRKVGALEALQASKRVSVEPGAIASASPASAAAPKEPLANRLGALFG